MSSEPRPGAHPPQDTFQRAKQWVKELQRQGNPNIVIALAGNKSDLNSKRKVEPEEAESYASDNGIFFMETSAKTATNVNELFVAIARRLPKNTPQPRPGSTGRGRREREALERELATSASQQLGVASSNLDAWRTVGDRRHDDAVRWSSVENRSPRRRYAAANARAEVLAPGGGFPNVPAGYMLKSETRRESGSRTKVSAVNGARIRASSCGW